MILKGDSLGVEDRLEFWDGSAKKLGCDDHCTTIHVIKFIELKNTIKETSRIVFDQISVCCSLAKLTDEINHYC